MNHWIGWRENLQKAMVFPVNSICFTFFPIQISSSATLRASPVAKFQEKFYKEHKATRRSFAQLVFGDFVNL